MERVLCTTEVAEAALVGVPDEYRGETPKAFIVLKPGQRRQQMSLSPLERAPRPVQSAQAIEFRSYLPKTLIGKVLRRALRDEEAAKRTTSSNE